MSWKRLSRGWKRADAVPSGWWRRLWLVQLAEFCPWVPRSATPSRKPPGPADPLLCAGHTQDASPHATWLTANLTAPPRASDRHISRLPSKVWQKRVDFILHLFHLSSWSCAPFIFHSEFSFHPWLIWPSPNSKIYFFLSPLATCQWIASVSLSVSIFLL